MTRFRPCIDLHAGSVKQIIGGTLSDTAPEILQTNFTSDQPAAFFASLYAEHGLKGAHVIMLGQDDENISAAKEALEAARGRFGRGEGLQVGGGVTGENARVWIEAGAHKVIITSYLFPSGTFSRPHLLATLSALDNDKSKLVIDLSCRRQGDGWFVAMNKWQTITDFELTQESIALLSPHCSEFLIHAADVEGKQSGIDQDLVVKLAEWCSIPVTYAGGGRTLKDLDLVKELSGGKVDLTIGSALDIFGGKGVKFEDCVRWNKEKGS